MAYPSFDDLTREFFAPRAFQQPSALSQWGGYPGTGQTQAMYGAGGGGAGGNPAAMGNPQQEVGIWDSLEAFLDGGGGESIDWWAQNVNRTNNTPMSAIDHAPVPGGSPLAGPGVVALQTLIQQLGGY